MPSESWGGCRRRAGAVPLAEQPVPTSAAVGVGAFRGAAPDRQGGAARSEHGHPARLSFRGSTLAMRGAFHTFFHVEEAHFDPRTLTYTVHFAPVVTDNFRLVIERTTATATPQSWSAELAEMQVFGTDAAAGAATAFGRCGGGEAQACRTCNLPLRSLFRRSRTWDRRWRSAHHGTGWCWISSSRASCRLRWILSAKASWA